MGIDQPIQIRLVKTSGSGGTVYYRVSGSRLSPNDYQTNPGSWSLLTFTGNNSASISITNNQNFGFANNVVAAGVTNTYEVRNLSDANALLATFTASRVALSFDYGTFANPAGTNRDYIYEFNEDFNVIP